MAYNSIAFTIRTTKKGKNLIKKFTEFCKLLEFFSKNKCIDRDVSLKIANDVCDEMLKQKDFFNIEQI